MKLSRSGWIVLVPGLFTTYLWEFLAPSVRLA